MSIQHNSLFQYWGESRQLLNIDPVGTVVIAEDMTLTEAKEVIGQLAMAYFLKFNPPEVTDRGGEAT